MITRLFVLRVSIFLALTYLSPVHAEPGADLHSWLDGQFEEELRFTPNAQTKLGRKVQYDQVNDYSVDGEKEILAWLETSVAAMKNMYSYEKLNPQEQISFDFWVYRLDLERAAAPWMLHDYAVTQMTASHTDLPQLLINYHVVDNAADMQAYIKRLVAVGVAIRQISDRVQQSADKGIRAPQFVYDMVIDESARVISGRPFDESPNASALWANAQEKIDALVEHNTISLTQAATLKQQAAQALVKEVAPAYRALIDGLKKDRIHADVDARGVYALPDGDKYYNYRLQKYTTTDLNAEQIHQLGLSEVERIRSEMEDLKRAAGFTGSLSDFFNFVRDDQAFYFANDDAGRQKFMDQTEFYLERLNRKLPEYFGILPAADLVVRRVEAFREQDGAAAFYEEGTADGSRPGVYYMHLSDMAALNITDLQTTAFHEGNPGHHMQSSIANENANLPMFRRSVWYSAYGEGWALYAEKLAAEMGVYDDVYYDFGRLVGEIFRAIRLVVDTGIHAKGWSEERAVQYMLENSAVPETSVRSEIRRYIALPAQATSYKIGMLKILELRQWSRTALGASFDIREFHDLVLGGGSLPLDILEQSVQRWVEQKTPK